MILQFLSWWLVSTILGLLAFPVIWRLLPNLPDRGFAFARMGGILLVGYVYWLGASLGLLPNSFAGSLGAVVILAVMTAWVIRNAWEPLLAWFSDQRGLILRVEIIFLVSFAIWALVRASNPDITGTEKPMELAFINAILRSDSFPPRDPWLSGYSISYYYFGYIQLAFLTRLTGVSSGVGFNLGNALWFGLSMLGTYSLVFNLVNHKREKARYLSPMLGPLFVVITGNLQAFLEVLHARRLFWTGLDGGQPVSAFWSWLGIKDLTAPPVGELSWAPNRYFWWWRASRVINDVNLSGGEVEVIDEFPFFSFLLADNHPHLLALPIALLTLTLALHMFYAGRRTSRRLGSFRWSRQSATIAAAAAGAFVLLSFISGVMQSASGGASFMRAAGEALIAAVKTGLMLGGVGLLASIALGGTKTTLTREEFFASAFLFGGLAFQNTWDLPLYGSVFILVIWWSQREKDLRTQLWEVAIAGMGMLVGAIVLYLPWYPSFASQAGGILPNIIFPTRTQQFLVMFATAAIPLAIWLTREAVKGLRKADFWRWLLIAAGLPLLLWLFSLILTAFLALYTQRYDPISFEIAMYGLGADRTRDVLAAVLERRLTASLTVLLLGGGIGAAFLLLWKRFRVAKSRRQGPEIASNAFVLMLFLVGALLILAPEYVYLADQFGTRMNTIFKFYFAAWTMWGIAAAYVSITMLERATKGRVLIYAAMLPFVLGLLYPAFGTWTKTNGFNPPEGYTLNGTAYLERVDADDAAAIEWMNTHLDDGVIAEAVGGSYTTYARISTNTGFSTVLGWPGHETQWRGSAEPLGNREADIRQLYQTRSWNETEAILDRYDIDYVYIGALERRTYQPVIDAKFTASMQLVFQQGEVEVYARLDEVNP